jgi:intraflagellar transport protein 172
VVRALEFSPCSTKLAVAQSDAIVFIYKLGTDWKDRKSICNKFPQSSSVTCLAWPSKHPNEIVFALADGVVKVGQLKANKAAKLYHTDSHVLCL